MFQQLNRRQRLQSMPDILRFIIANKAGQALHVLPLARREIRSSDKLIEDTTSLFQIRVRAKQAQRKALDQVQVFVADSRVFGSCRLQVLITLAAMLNPIQSLASPGQMGSSARWRR